MSKQIKAIKAWAVVNKYGNLFRYADDSYAIFPSKSRIKNTPLGRSDKEEKSITQVLITPIKRK